MRTADKIAAVVLVASGLTLLSHGADALMAQTDRRAPEYDTVARVSCQDRACGTSAQSWTAQRTSGTSSTGPGWTTM